MKHTYKDVETEKITLAEYMLEVENTLCGLELENTIRKLDRRQTCKLPNLFKRFTGRRKNDSDVDTQI